MNYCGNPLMKECGECTMYGEQCNGKVKGVVMEDKEKCPEDPEQEGPRYETDEYEEGDERSFD